MREQKIQIQNNNLEKFYTSKIEWRDQLHLEDLQTGN
jgi:hypothetical protein